MSSLQVAGMSAAVQDAEHAAAVASAAVSKTTATPPEQSSQIPPVCEFIWLKQQHEVSLLLLVADHLKAVLDKQTSEGTSSPCRGPPSASDRNFDSLQRRQPWRGLANLPGKSVSVWLAQLGLWCQACDTDHAFSPVFRAVAALVLASV
jgi:hypothetical protein